MRGGFLEQLVLELVHDDDSCACASACGVEVEQLQGLVVASQVLVLVLVAL